MTFESPPRWFHLVENPDGGFLLTLEKNSHKRFWPSRILADQPVPFAEMRGKDVTVGGPGASWMYAHIGAGLAAVGARASYKGGSGDQGTSHDPSHCEVAVIPGPGPVPSSATLRVHASKSHTPVHAVIAGRIQEGLDGFAPAVPSDLTLTGIMTNRGYLEAAGLAVVRGVRVLRVLQPNIGLVTVHGGGLVGEKQFPTREQLALFDPVEHPVLVGVIGDPNRGKSILSTLLDLAREEMGKKGWRLDCDVQAPTPGWYLMALKVDPEGAKKMRKGYKVPWNQEMEREIADQMHLVRRFFATSLADLPGGKPADGDNPAERIPPGREVMFRVVDRFLLVDDEVGGTEAAWRAELARVGLEDRLAAVVRSTHPKGPGAHTPSSSAAVFRSKLSGLDREKELPALLEAIRPGLVDLWNHLYRGCEGPGPFTFSSTA